MSPRLRKRKQNNEHLGNENTKKRKSKFDDDDSEENELKLFPEKNIHKNVKTKGNVNISDGENLINFSC